jgi:hypothetical protein
VNNESPFKVIIGNGEGTINIRHHESACEYMWLQTGD